MNEKFLHDFFEYKRKKCWFLKRNFEITYKCVHINRYLFDYFCVIIQKLKICIDNAYILLYNKTIAQWLEYIR